VSGTIYKRGERSWAFSLYLGRDPNTGKQIRIFKSGFETKRAAQDARDHEVQDLRERRALKWSPRNIKELLDAWFKEHAEQYCSPKTLERYRQLAAYLDADFCQNEISDIDPLAVEQELHRIHASGGHHPKTREPRPLGTKTVRSIASILHSAFRAAVRWRFIRFNPIDAIQLPRLEQTEKRVLDVEQTAAYLAAANGHWVQPILNFAVATGCRRGEILALQWSDLDLQKQTAAVRKSLEQTKGGLRIKSPKNGRPRLVYLPASLVRVLNEHKVEQAKHQDMFGGQYRADQNLVFADPAGDYLKPDSVTASACLVAQWAGLKGIGLHSLRHSHGSQLLSEGVPLPAVSKRLGHSSTDVTAKVYAHSFNADEIAAARIWEERVGATLDAKTTRQTPQKSVAKCSEIAPDLLMGKGLVGSANGNRTRFAPSGPVRCSRN
jgi:integrase